MNTGSMNGYGMNDPAVLDGEVPLYVSPFSRKAYVATAGVNNLQPNLRGTSCIILVENKLSAGSWALETITGVSRDAGRRR